MHLDVSQQPRATESVRGSMPASPDASLHDWNLAELVQRLYAHPSRLVGYRVVSWYPAPLDRAILDQAYDDRDMGRERLETALRSTFDAEPLEDGVSHPAEDVVEAAVRVSDAALDWLSDCVLDAGSPSFGASTLRCLSRLNDVGTAAWRTGLVRDALANEDVQVRDAALQAAEAWGGVELLRALATHLSSEPVAWLRTAMQDVVENSHD